MEDWIPFLQSLIWPVFVAVLLVLFRSQFQELLEVVKKRVQSGSGMSVGPTGFTLGPVPKLPEQEGGTGKTPEETITDYTKEAKKRPSPTETALELTKYFYLVHSASYNPEWSRRKGKPYYTIKVWLEADSPAFLNKVSKVVYHLHPTFPDPNREILTRTNNFELVTYAWGQFNLSADVYFEDGEQPLRLFRYLNF